MSAPASYPWSYRSVAVYKADRVYFAAGEDAADRKGKSATLLCRWDGTWGSKAFKTVAVSIAIVLKPELSVLMMGREGVIVRGIKTGFALEPVDAGKEGPQHIGDLQEIRSIGLHAYVVGMGRTVYRCEGPGSWVRIDHGVRCDAGDDSDGGFRSIHGLSERDVCAVGFNGEIWRSDGKSWTKQKSPTRSILNRVVCAPGGITYACGQGGTLIIGRGSTWRQVKHKATTEDFYGATWFKGALYLSTSNGLFRFRKGSLEPVDLKSKTKTAFTFRPGESFGKLDSTSKSLWSVGPKMVLHSEDGVSWTETPYGN